MDITVILLAAGNSTRFWPLSCKSLFPFFGKPFLQHQIEVLQKVGLENITVICNKDNIDLIKIFHDDCLLQIGEGQGNGILSAKEKIKGPVLVVNAIDFFSTNFLKNALTTIGNDLTNNFLTAVKVDSYFPGGYLILKNNLITEIIEKPGSDKMPSNLFSLNFDYYAHGLDLLTALEKVVKNDYEKAKNYLMQNGNKFFLLDYQDKWASLKYPWHVLDFTQNFLWQIEKSRISENAQIAESAIIKGPVIIEEEVRIFENAKIVGPCYLGKNVIVGNNCIVRESIIEEGCVLGFSTDVARSYLGKNCWFHSNYLGDSVLEENISLGAGANLANLRLDEEEIVSLVKNDKINTNKNKLGVMIGKNVRIGVNTSIMPGIKIGSGSFIGSGITIDEDIEENKFVTGKTKIVIKNNTFQGKKSREEFRSKL